MRVPVRPNTEAAPVKVSGFVPGHRANIVIAQVGLHTTFSAGAFQAVDQQIVRDLLDGRHPKTERFRAKPGTKSPIAIKPQGCLTAEITRDDKEHRRYSEPPQLVGHHGCIAALTVVEGQQAEGLPVRPIQALREFVQVNEIEPPGKRVNMAARLLPVKRVLVDDDAPALETAGQRQGKPSDGIQHAVPFSIETVTIARYGTGQLPK
jgi:hypothetical protein